MSVTPIQIVPGDLAAGIARIESVRVECNDFGLVDLANEGSVLHSDLIENAVRCFQLAANAMDEDIRGNLVECRQRLSYAIDNFGNWDNAIAKEINGGSCTGGN